MVSQLLLELTIPDLGELPIVWALDLILLRAQLNELECTVRSTYASRNKSSPFLDGRRNADRISTESRLDDRGELEGQLFNPVLRRSRGIDDAPFQPSDRGRRSGFHEQSG